MIADGANGIRSTRIFLAWIITTIVSARLTGATVLIRVTSKNALVAQTDVAQETIVVHPASD